MMDLTFPVRLGAPLDQPEGILGELLDGLHELGDLVHDDGCGEGRAIQEEAKWDVYVVPFAFSLDKSFEIACQGCQVA